MTTTLLVLVVLMVAYGIYFVCTHLEKEEKNGKKAPQKDGNRWAEILPGYMGRTVEIVVKAPPVRDRGDPQSERDFAGSGRAVAGNGM